MTELTSEDMEGRFLERFDRGCNIGVGPGWFPLLADLDDELSAIDPDYRLRQVKQKFGGLSFYANMSDGAAGTPVDQGNPAYQRFYAAIRVAENASYRICEECGDQGFMHTTRHGWLMTLCPACAVKEKAKPLRNKTNNAA